MRILIVSIIILLSWNAHSDECAMPKSTEEIDKFNDLIKGSDCNPIKQETWQPEWKSPCDCIDHKDLATKLKSADALKEKSLMLRKQIETDAAEAIRAQFYNELEQTIRLDIYVKKGVISPDGNINSLQIKEDAKVAIPSSCRLDKVADTLKQINNAIADNKKNFSCNPENMKRKMQLIFGSAGFEGWRSKQQELLERAVTNQLRSSEKNNGMCIPYKSYLSLNISNPLRTTYLKVAKAFKGNFSSFQKWAMDRSNPSDSNKIIAESELMANGRYTKTAVNLPVLNNGKTLFQGITIVSTGSMINRMMTNITKDEIQADTKSGVEDVSQKDIVVLLKTDPVFERMVKDQKFFDQMLAQSDPSKVSENDPKIIKLIAESSNRSCEDLYGGGVQSKEIDVPLPVDGPVNRGSKAKTNKVTVTNLADQNTLTRYLCDDEFPKGVANAKYIKNASTVFQGMLKASKDDAQLIAADYLYCQSDKKISLADPNALNISSTPQINFDNKNPLQNILNPVLNPISDIGVPNDLSEKRDSLFANFNASVCKYVPSECKKSTTDATTANCNIVEISKVVTNNMIAAKAIEIPDENDKKEVLGLNDFISNTDITDKDLRLKLAASNKFTKDEIDTVVILRQQTAPFMKLKAESELRAILGSPVTAETVLDDTFYNNRGGKDKVLHTDGISNDLRDRILGKSDANKNDNFMAEEVLGDRSSYFSNYFALANSADEESLLHPNVKKTDPSVPQIPTTGSGDVASNGNASTPGQSDTPTTTTTGPTTADAPPPSGYQRKSFHPDRKGRNLPGDGPTIPPEIPKSDPQTPPTKVVKSPEPDITVKPVDKAPIQDAINNLVAPEKQEDVSKSFSLTSSSSSSSSSSHKADDGNKSRDENLTTKQLESRLDYLQKLAAEEEAKKKNADQGSDAVTNPEIENLKNDIAREKTRIANQNRMNAYNADRNRGGSGSDSSGRSSGSSFGNNGFGNNGNNGISNGNDVNAYDPLDRATTGRRDLKDKDAKTAAAAKTNKDKEGDEESSDDSGGGASVKPKKTLASSGSSSSDAGGGGLGGGGSAGGKKGGRFPAQDNGEGDPDDICGYDQKMACYFEFASIDALSPSLARFVEYLQLQGRSFKALEVYKYKNKKMPTKYFVHEYEPAANMSEADKTQLYERVKKLSQDYKKNRAALKKMASAVVEVKKYEISREEVKELSKSILRLPDLNKLSARRARNQ